MPKDRDRFEREYQEWLRRVGWRQSGSPGGGTGRALAAHPTEASFGSLVAVYPSLTYNPPVFVFIETKLFSRLAEDHLSDDEYRALQQTLIANPETGDLIRGSGGLRKLRWPGTGHGKRGGLRIIYYLRTRLGEIWLLTLYPKNVSEDIPVKVLRKIKEQIDGQG